MLVDLREVLLIHSESHEKKKLDIISRIMFDGMTKSIAGFIIPPDFNTEM